MVRFSVLGPLEVEDSQRSVDLRGPRHRAVLARLLVARGRVVPVRWLIDDLWDDAPEGALSAVQTFVGALRKALEPERPPRAPSRLLVTAPPGYAVHAQPDAVDAWRFETAIADSGELLAGGRSQEAHRLLDEALRTWRGPAYAEFAELAWARGEAGRLEQLRLLAVELRAEAAVALGRAAAAVPDLQVHVTAHPLREEGWRLLTLALYAAGRQGEALAVLRRARQVLQAELGVAPGPRLEQLQADVLAHAPRLIAALAVPRTGSSPQPTDTAAPDRRPGPDGHPFVGRAEELAALEQEAATAGATGRPRLLLLSGAAGAGKTTLAGVLAGRLRATGWTTAWGSSPESPGAPAAWPWAQMQHTLAAAAHEPALTPVAHHPAAEDAPGDPVAARFRRTRAASTFLAEVARTGPVLLVFDDLQWADEETLALVTALAADAGAGPVLVVGTYRPTDVSAGLTEALARAARTEPTRVHLAGLSEAQVGELIHASTHREMAPSTARAVHTRSAGNPFFVRELIRLWESGGDAALRTVPSGVRDVIRHRLAQLPTATRTHLRQASVLGPLLDVDVLVCLAGDEDGVLQSVEAALLAGFLTETDAPDRPGADRLRFSHALVQEALYDDLPRARRAQWHAVAARTIERARPSDVEAITHHLLRSGDRVPAAQVALYAQIAAQRAEQRTVPHEAARLWREALTALDRSAAPDPRTRLAMVMGLGRALAVTGDLQQARRHRAEAVTAVESLGDPVLTAAVLGAFDVPAVWTASDDEALSAHLVEVAERTLATLPAGYDAERARLLVTVAMERRADSGPRGDQAAQDAEGTARRLGDPRLMALALNGRFLQTFSRAGLAPQRARIGEQLLSLTTGHEDLATFEVLGHLILVQARAALADLQAADRHATAVDQLATRYDLPLVGAFTSWYAALRLAITGRTEQARAGYRSAAARLTGTGMSGVEHGILPLALLSVDAHDSLDSLGALAGLDTADGADGADWGAYADWVRPLVLLAQGEDAEGRAAASAVPDSPRDLLLEARACLHTIVAVHTEDRATARRLYHRLLPAAGELAGAGSGLLTLGPTALYLGHLSTTLGHPSRAAQHYRQAEAMADAVQAPHWAATARDALHRIEGLTRTDRAAALDA